MNVDTLSVAADLSIDGLKAGAEAGKKIISGLADAFIGLGKTAISPLGAITGAVSGMVDTLSKVGYAAIGLKSVAEGAIGMVSALTAGNAALEMVTISFTTLLGSASAANDMIRDLTTFAANTPFNLPGLELATQRLLGAGYAANEIIPLMTALGDSIAALGGTQDQLNSLVYVMGQMRNEAHLNAGDIMQMANLGIPALQMLADHYGKTTAEIQEMISKGLIPGKEAATIFAEEMEKKYGGMMEAQSKTFSGMVSNLQDWAGATMIILTKPFFEPAKKALKAFLDFVQSPAGVAAINRLAGYIQTGVDKATAAFTRAIPLLKVFWANIEPVVVALWKFHEAISPIGIALDVLQGYMNGGVAGALDAFKERFELIGGYIKRGLDLAMVEARKYGPAMLAWVAETAITLAQRAVVLGESLIGWVAPYAVRLLNELLRLGASVLNWIADHARAITSQVFNWATSFVSWVAPAIPQLINALIDLGGRVLNWVVDYAPILANQALMWIQSIVGWVLMAVPELLNALAQFGVRIVTWISQEAPILTNMLLAWSNVLAGWILPAIPLIIGNLEQVGLAVLNWGVTTLPNLIGQFIIAVGQGLGVNLSGPVNSILVVFNSLVSNIRTTVLPAFMEMARFIGTDVVPLFNDFSNFLATSIIPLFASLAAFIMTVGVPAITRMAEVFGLIFGPSLRLISSVVQTELLPALTGMWQTFDQKYLPTIRVLANEFGDHLAGGIATVVGLFKTALPHVEAFYKKIEPYAKTILEIYNAFSPLSIALDVFKGFLEGGVQGALDAFTARMGKIGDTFSDIIPKILDGLSDALPKVFTWIEEQAPKFFEQLGTWAESFGKFAEKVMPPLLNALGKIIGGVLDWVTANGPSILEKLGEWAGKFGEWAKSVIPIVLEKLGDFVNTMLKWLGDKAPDILSTLGEWAGKFVEWAAGLIAKIYPELGKFAGKLWDWLGEQAPHLADKLMEWAGAFVGWIVTQAIPNLIQLLPKIWVAIFKFVGEIYLNIIKEVAKWTGAFLGWVWDVVSGLPGALWNIVSGIAGWVGNAAGSLVQVAGNIGSSIIQGIIGAIHDAPGKIWDAVTGVLGSGAVNIIKGIVQTVANFFVDVVNTPINLINSLVETLRNVDFPIVGKILGWLPTIPKLGYLSFAQGTNNAPGGPAWVGDNPFGPEMVITPNYSFMANSPMLMGDLPKGSKVLTPDQYGGGGKQVVIEQHFHISPDLDASLIPQLAAMAYQAAAQALESTGQGGVAKQGFYAMQN